MKKIKLPKVDPNKVRKLNEGVDDDSGNKYLLMTIVLGIATIVILVIVL
ncbi:MAG: hypothetical protein PF487_06630 [Bacteroidales bacterium]|jgi:hypothetical protein|nr:hypothetical protein [Bacteroidales bacterium]